MKNNQVKNYFSTTELAKILGISRIAVFKKIKSGDIKAEKVGRNYIIKKEDNPKLAFDVREDNLNKKVVEQAVKKAIHDYGEAIKMLGKE